MRQPPAIQDSTESQLPVASDGLGMTIASNDEEFHSERPLLRAVIDALPDFIFVKDRRDRFITANRSMLIALGVADESEIVGKTDYDFHPEAMADGFVCDDESVMSSGVPLISREEEHVDAGGKRRWLSTTKVPMTDAAGQVAGLIGISREITVLKELERERDAVVRDLERSNHDLEQFAYVVSHDLKAPLRAITNLSSWIAEDLADSLTAESMRHMSLLRQRVARLDMLISDILKYSRAGQVEGDAIDVDTTALVQHVVRTLELDDAWKIITPDHMPTVYSQRTPLEQVFSNLINNAVKHHHAPSAGRIEIGAIDASPFVEFFVRDNGPGIDQRFHAKIFEVFRTLRPEDQTESTGIGLSIVKRLVERHGGTVRLDSEPGRGATFFFTWPQHA